jgi:hypothetical protein
VHGDSAVPASNGHVSEVGSRGPVRPRALAYLSTADTAAFPELRRRLGTTDGDLTSFDKRGTGRTSTTRVTLTAAGRGASSPTSTR